MVTLKEIVDAYSVDGVSETYYKPVEITDLKGKLGTKGHILVIRGDKAYIDELVGNEDLANPKFWMYESLINSERVQEALKQSPNHKLFDGVGYSSLEALGFHAKKSGRKAIVVMAHEMIPNPEVFERYDIKVIHADGVMEEGYVQKQAEVLSERDDLIPLHQALYGAQGLASIGNKIAQQIEELGIKLDATFWCIASGSNLYGVGSKIKQRFPECRTVVVEPETNKTIDDSIDFSNSEQVRNFAREKLRSYSLEGWDKKYSGVFPLHVSGANRYLLLLWAHTGKFGFDEVKNVSTQDVFQTQRELSGISVEYDWTRTTALTLKSAIESAKEGKNVLVMSYGKNRKNNFRNLIINND